MDATNEQREQAETEMNNEFDREHIINGINEIWKGANKLNAHDITSALKYYVEHLRTKQSSLEQNNAPERAVQFGMKATKIEKALVKIEQAVDELNKREGVDHT